MIMQENSRQKEIAVNVILPEISLQKLYILYIVYLDEAKNYQLTDISN